MGLYGVQIDCVLKIWSMDGLFAVLSGKESLGFNLSSNPKLLGPLSAATHSVNMEVFREGVARRSPLSG